MARRGPLRACGISMIEILSKASTKTTDFNGPIGSMMKMVLTLFSALFPLIIALQNQLLAILSYVDDRILAVESIVESLFPPSKHLFDKVDKLVYVVESLPEKFDEAMNKFHVFIHEVPFLDWALAYAISWLNFFIIMLTRWGSKSTMDRDIIVDIDCNKPECSNRENVEDSSNAHDSSQIKNKEKIVKDSSSEEPECKRTENLSHHFDSEEHEKRSKNLSHRSDSEEHEKRSKNLSHRSDSEEHDKRSKNMKPFSKTHQRRRSYKEILESGTKESAVKTTRKIPRNTRKKRKEKKKKKENEDEDKTDSNSDLLELLDTSEHLNQPKRTMSAPMLL